MAKKKTTKKKTSKTGSRRRRASQQDMDKTGVPGFERDPELTRLAEKLADARNERMEAGRDETKAQDELLRKMKEKGIEEFTDTAAGIKATIVHEKEKISVKKLSAKDKSKANEQVAIEPGEAVH